MRVLVITKNPDLGDLLAMALPLHGLEVATAPSGVAAVSLGSECRPAAIIFDIELAVDWTDCAALVAAVPVPIIAFTGWIARNGRYRRRALDAGCAAFVAKPCSAGGLVDVIARVTAGERGIEIVSG